MNKHEKPDESALEELDIAVHDLDGQEREEEAKSALRSLAGVDAVRIIERGIWLRYRATTVSSAQIVAALRQAGFDATVFQDSATGETTPVKY